MKKMFLILGLIEIIAALIILIKPDILFLNEFETSFVPLIKMYAIAAFCLGLIAIQVYKYFDYNKMVRFLTIIFVVFHGLLAFHLYGMYDSGFIIHPGPFASHATITLVILVVYYREIKNFDQVNM